MTRVKDLIEENNRVMKLADSIETEDENPDCWKGVPGCKCKVGFSYEEMCPRCRDEQPRDPYSRCVCPPKD